MFVIKKIVHTDFKYVFVPLFQYINTMAKGRLYKRFTSACQKTDGVLKHLYKPIETLTRIVVQLCLIIGMVFFIISPSIDKTLFVVPFLINLGIQFKNRKEQAQESP
jgi:hypothetical protein